MNFLIVLALIALSAVHAVPHAQNSVSEQQQQQLSMQLEQRLKEAGFDVSTLPHDSNGNIDISKLPRDSNGNIQLSQIVNEGGTVNGNGGVRVNVHRHDGAYVHGHGGANGNGGGGSNVHGDSGGNAGGCNYQILKSKDKNVREGSGANYGSEGRSGPNGEIGPHQLKPSETGGKYDEYESQFGSKDGKIGVTDIGEIVCNDGGLTTPLGHVINGTQITLNCLTDTAKKILQKVLDKKGAKGGKKNIFGRAASQADNTLQVFFEGLGREGRIFFCGIYETVVKLLKALKSGHPIGGILRAAQYFTGGAEQFFGDIPNGIGQTLKQAEHGVGKILNLKGSY